MTLAIDFKDITDAAERLRGHAHRTPVLTSRTADERTGAQVFFKAENLQRMGAFKFRGAFNALAQFTPGQRERGVIAFSSGNHAQAIALSAAAAGHAERDRDAAGRTGGQARGHARLPAGQPGSEVVPFDRYTAGPRGHRATPGRASAA